MYRTGTTSKRVTDIARVFRPQSPSSAAEVVRWQPSGFAKRRALQGAWAVSALRSPVGAAGVVSKELVRSPPVKSPVKI